MSLLYEPPRKSLVTEDWQEPEWALWSEPGIPREVHAKMWPVWVIGLLFWAGVIGVCVGRRLGL